MAGHNTNIMAIVLFNMLFIMNCRVDFGNEGPVQDCCEVCFMLCLFYFLKYQSRIALNSCHFTCQITLGPTSNR